MWPDITFKQIFANFFTSWYPALIIFEASVVTATTW